MCQISGEGPVLYTLRHAAMFSSAIYDLLLFCTLILFMSFSMIRCIITPECCPKIPDWIQFFGGKQSLKIYLFHESISQDLVSQRIVFILQSFHQLFIVSLLDEVGHRHNEGDVGIHSVLGLFDQFLLNLHQIRVFLWVRGRIDCDKRNDLKWLMLFSTDYTTSQLLYIILCSYFLQTDPPWIKPSAYVQRTVTKDDWLLLKEPNYLYWLLHSTDDTTSQLWDIMLCSYLLQTVPPWSKTFAYVQRTINNNDWLLLKEPNYLDWLLQSTDFTTRQL